MKYSSSFEELSDLENFMLITKVMYVHNTYTGNDLLFGRETIQVHSKSSGNDLPY